ncbi:glycoside hydrolase family 3 N-terminal domain-containing protein [Robiginitalea sp. M366]|uniref:glycoside hydrolase family 3 protein n=1 Tax=Robiginitalea aestuariiviva TaxID=3036903 RepID=UPI00240E5FF2|nr:glycoside hydrolase family 3 N-terminal domain-containing protein [Robiginitalea aestuariiviva]MDG1573443.1 glycoside hydrolase family 3 N-terminal domain-containing protein [Robiginitalea aestuariiviva]
MKPTLYGRFACAALTFALLLSSCGPKWEETQKDGFNVVTQAGGQTLGYAPGSGVTLLTEDRYAFKDLNRNGSLEPYEDWRLTARQRAEDLAGRMSVEQIAGLMLYSAHQRVPGGGFGGRDTYNGQSFEESGALPSDLTDQQKAFLTDDNLRHVLITTVERPGVAARWNNNVQALVEGLGLGIPANNSTDPRHEAASDEEFTMGAGGDISRWPNAIGLAASFDPALVQEFGRIASIEYRALGLATALSPQVDLATDPRWYRFSGTFGEEPRMATAMARAYVDGFQTSSAEKEIAGGWGYESVNAMVKHWPGGGAGEGGRDAHYGFGKFAVFPGNNLDMHRLPFTEGAFKLDGGTGKAAAVMPYYTISFGQDPAGDNVGNAFSKYFITDMLRGTYGYDGVVCTDWGVTRPDEGMAVFGRTPWGVEGLTEAQRHYRILMAGCDQFGGNNAAGPVLEAYQMGVEEHGEEYMRTRMETSARRLLTNIFQVGLFENPYLDVAETEAVVGNPEFMKAGYEAQQKSVVLLKNEDGVLPLAKTTKVYIPQRFVPPSESFFGDPIPGRWEDPIRPEIASRYFETVDTPEAADVALVVITSPINGRTAGYSTDDAEAGGNGFFPISLQYEPYTATEARDPSLAGDPREGDVLNRTYKGKAATAHNSTDLQLIRDTQAAMQGKPVVVVLKLSNPTVVAEFEPGIQGLLVNFNVSDQAVLDIVSGAVAPSGLLPLQMPAHMATVERQYEDVPLDMEVHVDQAGHAYDFGYGMNWEGPIQDARTERFKPAED